MADNKLNVCTSFCQAKQIWIIQQVMTDFDRGGFRLIEVPGAEKELGLP